MKTYRLIHGGFIHPQWFNRVRHGRHAGLVDENGLVLVDGVRLEPSEPGLQSGEEVEVWIDGAGHFAGATKACLEREAQERAAVRLRLETEREQALARSLDASRAFNASLCVPVPWTVSIKDVLSGLSGSSNGDGYNKATVHHVRVLEAIRDGRLVRAAGDLLCTSAGGSNGKNWAQQSDVGLDHQVSCKRCLAIASRWMRAPHHPE